MKSKLKQAWLILSLLLYIAFVFAASCVVGLAVGLGYFVDRIKTKFD